MCCYTAIQFTVYATLPKDLCESSEFAAMFRKNPQRLYAVMKMLRLGVPIKTGTADSMDVSVRGSPVQKGQPVWQLLAILVKISHPSLYYEQST